MSLQRSSLIPVLITVTAAMLTHAQRHLTVTQNISEHSRAILDVTTLGYEDSKGDQPGSQSIEGLTKNGLTTGSLILPNKQRNNTTSSEPKNAIKLLDYNSAVDMKTDKIKNANKSTNSRSSVHKRSLTNEQADKSNEDDVDSKRAFKFGKRVRVVADQSEVDEKRAFKFGKKSSEKSSANVFDNENKIDSDQFIIEKQPSDGSTDDSHSVDDQEKRAFKFGKKSSPQSMNIEDDSEYEKRGFKFGKKSSSGVQPLLDTDIDDDISGGDKRAFKFGKRVNDNEDEFLKERRAFKFGKRDDDEERNEKRAFKFGKRLNQDEDEVKREKKAFKFGKRESAKEGYSSEEDVNNLSLSGTNQFKYASILNDHNVDKRPIKFGKKSMPLSPISGGVQHIPDSIVGDAEYIKKAFKFGKKSVSNSKNYDVINSEDLTNNKRAFKFGKKSEPRRPASRVVNREDNRMFKFGKKSSSGYEPNVAYSRYPETMDQLVLEGIRVPAHGMYVTGVKRYLKPGGRITGYFPERISWRD